MSLKNYLNKLDWLKRNKKFSFYFKINQFNKNSNFIKEWLDINVLNVNSQNLRKVALICDLACLYPHNILILKFNEYKRERSITKKIIIRYGSDKEKEFTEKLKKRKRPTNFSIFTTSYWIKRKGFTEEEAKNKIFTIQSNISKKKHEKYKFLKNAYKEENPISLLYWEKRGYSLEESKQLRLPFLHKCSNKLEHFIEKYGFDLGVLKYHSYIDKRKNTMLEKYGSLITNGRTSKESLRRFIPLYKILRRNGINKDDIYWGIKGSKEYCLFDKKLKKPYFFDFTIKTKKVIIEYNHTLFHPRKKTEWEDTFYQYEEKKKYDERKVEFAKKMGFKVFIIWNDKKTNMNKIIERVFK